MASVGMLVTDLAVVLRHHQRPLLVYYLFFAVLATAVLVPVAAAPLGLVERFSDRSAVTTGGLFTFATSPGGALWMLATVFVTMLLATLQQAGMTLIPAGTGRRRGRSRYLAALAALWDVARRAPELTALTVIQVGAHGLVASPFLLLAAVAWEILVSPHDGYYLRVVRPPELWLFAGAVLVAGSGLLACNGLLYLRWVLAVPVLMIERCGPVAALARSAALVRGRARPLVGAILAAALFTLFVPLVFGTAFGSIGGRLLGWLPDRSSVIAPAVLLFLTLYIVLGIALAFLAIAVHNLLAYAVYARAIGHDPRVRTHAPPRRAGVIAWSAELVLVVVALGQAATVLVSLETRDQPAIIAHRGSSALAPENTLSAIEQAIADGADYIELDLRRTADGVPVLWHDATLMRIAGVHRYVREVSFAELRMLDAGGWFSPRFSGEPVATLEEALELACRRARLYLEIKPAPDASELVRDTIGLLQRAGCVEGTVIASMDPGVVRHVRRLDPDLATALLAQFIVGPLDEHGFDALGLRHNRVTPRAVAAARRGGYELHAWTVNERADMVRLLDMGVDGIITDYPHVLADLLAERAAMSDTERLLVRMRSWLAR